ALRVLPETRPPRSPWGPALGPLARQNNVGARTSLATGPRTRLQHALPGQSGSERKGGGMTGFHGTTILAVRHRDRVALGGDGQVTLGDTVVKGSAQKVRKLRDGRILAGFAGSVADGLTLFDKFEEKLERHPANL